MEIGEQKQVQNNEIKPKNNMGLAVIATIIGVYSFLFLGFFLGLVAVGFAKRSKYKSMHGDYAGAVSAANKVKRLSYIIFILVLIAVIYTVYVINKEGGINVIMEKLQEQNAINA
ncbi:hypothetical protein AV926_02215 [Myroides marinus]|uniref:Interferon-induced transmembrane protein n=1 Tax=Myroides marinus TaxID=703342 RepID=A0A161S3V6_9FLAO|nr:CD225/dispanin family protein [Myroides marinus]KUF44008.1 hypothetical protein AS361_05935 [Myroides marinus]KZE73615.1 hypothetical protein AV926_02215 [Myroides marinus]